MMMKETATATATTTMMMAMMGEMCVYKTNRALTVWCGD